LLCPFCSTATTACQKQTKTWPAFLTDHKSSTKQNQNQNFPYFQNKNVGFYILLTNNFGEDAIFLKLKIKFVNKYLSRRK
jgi:hypothetical protein